MKSTDQSSVVYVAGFSQVFERPVTGFSFAEAKTMSVWNIFAVPQFYLYFLFFIFLFLGRRVGKSCAVVATRPNSFTLGSCSNSPKLVIPLALRENKTCKDHESERFEEFVEFKR